MRSLAKGPFSVSGSSQGFAAVPVSLVSDHLPLHQTTKQVASRASGSFSLFPFPSYRNQGIPQLQREDTKHQGLQCQEKPSPCSDAWSKKKAPAAFHEDDQTLSWLCSAVLLPWEYFNPVFFALSHLPHQQLQCSGTQWELTWSALKETTGKDCAELGRLCISSTEQPQRHLFFFPAFFRVPLTCFLTCGFHGAHSQMSLIYKSVYFLKSEDEVRNHTHSPNFSSDTHQKIG